MVRPTNFTHHPTHPATRSPTNAQPTDLYPPAHHTRFVRCRASLNKEILAGGVGVGGAHHPTHQPTHPSTTRSPTHTLPATIQGFFADMHSLIVKAILRLMLEHRKHTRTANRSRLLVCTKFMGVSVRLSLSLARDESTNDFETDRVCGGPLFAPPFSSARVQSRVELVEIGSGMYVL